MNGAREGRVGAAWKALEIRKAGISNQRQVQRVELYLNDRARSAPERGDPVICFNASTRIHHLSQNAAFELLAAWAVRLAGVPCVQLVCHAGMQQCMLGTRRDDLTKGPPCTQCVKTSKLIYPRSSINWLGLDANLVDQLDTRLDSLSLTELADWEYSGLPLGALCMPSLRWAMRRHNLDDLPATRHLLRQYLVSAASLAARIEEAIQRLKPRSMVLFNGVSFPEGVARAVGMRHGVPVITHEVGLRPFSAFFSHEHATFREVALPEGFRLSDLEESRLDEVLAKRFHGRFSMAGVTFWPDMHPVPSWLEQRMEAHRQTVTIFTNVVFDTSQVHANALFHDMFDWLTSLLPTIERHDDTLFVLRAHPDEDRPGKESLETVAAWVQQTGIAARPNVVFLEPSAGISSYDLMMRSKFVMVYNSSIGLEASIVGLPVLCAGQARYTSIPTVYLPGNRSSYHEMLNAFLTEGRVEAPEDFRLNARRLFSYETYQASLSFERFMTELPQAPGNVLLRSFEPEELTRSAEVAVLQRGILDGQPFIMPWPSEQPIGPWPAGSPSA